MPPTLDLSLALRQHFGFPAFRSGQEAALGHVLAGRDTLVVMPTGAGKSLIYQLAALLLSGTALVISPLVALMKDQIDGLTRRNIAATFINSSLDAAEQARRLRAVADGQYRIVLVAPERLRSRPFREAIGRISLSLLAVDEAHCLSQWGHDFRPDYLHIAESRRELKAPVTLALTATATPRVQDDIIHLLGLPHAERLITGFNRPNLTLEVFSAPDVKAKLNLVRDFLAQAEGAGIIYTGTRRDAEEVAEFIRDVCGLEARYYHGALDAAARAETQEAFMAGDLPLIVATNAFGMGIDRPDVRFVLHYTVPGTLEAYYQEAGRAGRDGLPARAVLLYSSRDTSLHEFFIENDSPSADELRAAHSFASGPVKEFALEELERATGLPQTKARVALEQLEAAHALRRAPDEAYGVLRVEALPLSDSVLQKIAAQVAGRREHKRHQLKIMVDYAETNICRRRALLDHFGDTGTAEAPLCCDNCLTRLDAASSSLRRAESQSERAALIVLDTIAHLKWEVGKGKLAKILKGSTEQEMALYKQARNYAKFAVLRLYEIESLVGQLIDAGHIKQVGSRLPTLKLTPKGESALQARAAIRVDLRPVAQGAAQKLQAQKEAGGTVALSGQMLARGLTPEQIAAERGLTVYTIYSHLARLITDGQVSINAVVAADLQKQIRAAIEAIGSVEQLSPIKMRLPESIDYGVIRCVANAWQVEQGQSPPTPTRTSTGEDRAARVHALGESGDIDVAPELITALADADGNVRRLAASALGKLRTVAAVEPLLALIEREPGPQVRQYAIKALGTIGDERARTTLIKISNDPTEMEYNRLSAQTALKSLRIASAPLSHLMPIPEATRSGITQPPNLLPPDPVSAFLARPHPRPLKGPWLAGWTLDFNSRFSGAEHSRSEVGELVYLYKYRGERHLANDLAERWLELLAAHPELPEPDAVIPIPPSLQRDFDPVTLLAQTLATKLTIPALTNTLVKTRATKPQKEMTALAQKQANMAGAFALKGDVRGRRLILVDDLFDSGATVQEAARLLTRSGAISIVVLTLTKTIHADQ
ncbi:MAG: RecQ family ATP-dependent DNA helicase [Chloroflexi bacterium]|nr:RecQ family ATP-dependent DNA helicase [Chloroflexota bacterium]